MEPNRTPAGSTMYAEYPNDEKLDELYVDGHRAIFHDRAGWHEWLMPPDDRRRHDTSQGEDLMDAEVVETAREATFVIYDAKCPEAKGRAKRLVGICYPRPATKVSVVVDARANRVVAIHIDRAALRARIANTQPSGCENSSTSSAAPSVAGGHRLWHKLASRAMTQLQIAVVGAHLQGQPLNHQLTERGAQLLRSTGTAPRYRLFALATEPPKPGLRRVGADDSRGASIAVEVWQLDAAAFGDFVAQVPAPMCIGRVTLADGSDISGFLCEPIALEGATDITHFGGWRAYRAAAAGPA